MKGTLVWGLLCTLFLAQPMTAQDDLFFIIDYMKVKPGMDAEYVAGETGIWKTIHQKRIDQGLITGWWVYSVMSPAGSNVEHDYVTVSQVVGWEGLGKLNESWGMVMGSLTETQQKEAMAIEEARDLVRSEIIHSIDFVGKDDFGKNGFPKYAAINYMDVPPGGWDNYVKTETEMVKPVFAEMMKNGSGRAGWGVYGVAMPWGADRPYDAITVDFFETWGDMANQGDFMSALKKVHPGISEEAWGTSIESARTLRQGELWSLIDTVQAPPQE